jgi:hypothetical protein
MQGGRGTGHLVGDCPLRELNNNNRDQSDSGGLETA